MSVKWATFVQNAFFFGKLLAIGIIITVGFYKLAIKSSTGTGNDDVTSFLSDQGALLSKVQNSKPYRAFLFK